MRVALSAAQMDRSTMHYKTCIGVVFSPRENTLGLFVKSRHYTHVFGYNTNPRPGGAQHFSRWISSHQAITKPSTVCLVYICVHIHILLKKIQKDVFCVASLLYEHNTKLTKRIIPNKKLRRKG
jgi:hypothetical protein